LGKKINKTEILLQNITNIPSKEELIKEMGNLKIACEYIIPNKFSLKKFILFNSSYEELYQDINLNPPIDSKLGPATSEHINNLTNSINTEFNDISSILSNSYHDLISLINKNQNTLTKIRIFVKNWMDANFLSFFNPEFQNIENNLKIKENFNNNLTLLNLSQVIMQDIEIIKEKIFNIKQHVEKQYPSLNETSNYPFEILYNLKLIMNKPYFFIIHLKKIDHLVL
jgi:hypothetical protein